jgi:hypothetical protein
MRPQVTHSPDQRPLTSALVTFGGLTLTGIVLWALTASLGGAAIIDDPVAWLRGLDDERALEAISNAAEVVAAVLAIAMTVVAIVVELAANRYSHLITRLFVREPVNIMVLALFLLTTIQCVWASVSFTHSATDALVSHAGFLVTFSLVTISLLALLPYIYFVFTFLSPISVIERILQNAVTAIDAARRRDVTVAQRLVLAAVDELQDVSRGAIDKDDRSIAMTGVNAMSALVYDYAERRAGLPDAWFEVSEPISNDPDFIALTPDSIRLVEDERLWLETKICRQLYTLMTQSAGSTRDVANLIGINTGQLARDLGRDNRDLLRLCIRTFNSYLRATINAGDARSAYYIFDQYRDVAEDLLRREERDLVLQIAGYFRHYGQIAHRAGLSFLLDVAGQDVVQLIERAVREYGAVVDDLLSVLLELDLEIREESHEDSLLGVRRSQIKLATLFMQLGDEARVDRIVGDLKQERIGRLKRLKQGLESESRPLYWELTDRGANFGYLEPERRQHLEPLFEKLQLAQSRR